MHDASSCRLGKRVLIFHIAPDVTVKSFFRFAGGLRAYFRARRQSARVLTPDRLTRGPLLAVLAVHSGKFKAGKFKEFGVPLRAEQVRMSLM